MRRPFSSNFALILPVMFRRVASGLMIESVRSTAMSSRLLLAFRGKSARLIAARLAACRAAGLPRHMRRDGEPAPAPARPDVGVAPVPLLARRGLVGGARVDERDVAQKADADVVDGKAADRHRARRLLQKLPLVDERAVRVRAEKIIG